MRLLWLGWILSAVSVSANPSAGYQTKDTPASLLGTATIPQASTSAALPSAAAAAADQWKCATCQHVYDPVKDGGGKSFEDLPDTFKCPVCGSPKSAFKKQIGTDGSAYWVHQHMEKPSVPSAETWKCATCQHIYDPVKDGGGKAFEDLPDTFKCPVCGSPKSAFKKQVASDGSAYWAHEHMEKPSVPSAETWECATCQHIYDPVKDGGGKAFEDLPDAFKCPVCGSPKSAFKKQVARDGNAYWAHEHEGASVVV